MSYEERMMNGCIGAERGRSRARRLRDLRGDPPDLPAERVRIADRGLREGILMQLMAADRMWSHDGS